MSERKRPIQDLQAEVAAQLHLLKKAAHEFDAGDLLEVRNMARALRVLVAADDHGNAALIELAQMVAGPFLDTRTITHPKNLAPALELVGIILGPKTVGCRALLDDAPMSGTADFGTWLKQTVIDDKAGGIFNRLRLIKAVANVGGGTHYPPDIRTYFEKLQRLGVSASKRGQTVEQRFEDVENIPSVKSHTKYSRLSIKATYARDGLKVAR